MRLPELTAGQEALLGTVRDDWLAAGLSCRPADRTTAEAGVRDVYERAGLEPPASFVWLGSPLAGLVGAAILRDADQAAFDPGAIGRYQSAGDGEIARQVGHEIDAQVWEQVVEVWDELDRQVDDEVRHQLDIEVSCLTHDLDRVDAELLERILLQIDDQVGAQAGDRTWTGLRRRIRDDHAWGSVGQHDAGWLAWSEIWDELGVTDGRAAGHRQVGRSAGWWWPLRDVAVLTERPTELHRDADGRLHADTGPAIVYPDGWRLHRHHGARVTR